MARKRGKVFHCQILLWVAPLSAVVLAPLYLHFEASDLSNASDDSIVVAILLLFTIIGISIVGCCVDLICKCNITGLPLALLCLQLFLLFATVVLRSLVHVSHDIPATVPLASEGALAHFLSSRHPQIQQVIPSNNTQHLAVELPKERRHVSRKSQFEGWRKAGDGYCEDGEAHQEFSSLHAAGKTLKECALMGTNHSDSIAFDFVASNGGCDLRYPAGIFAQGEPGWSWWGWGAGLGNPIGSGKDKAELATQCYVRILHPTPVPTPVLPATIAPVSAVETEAFIARGKGRISIVLACAAEGAYMVNTVKSFCERTPADILQEIIVVDDGSDSPLSNLVGAIPERCRLKMLRHSSTMGLMIAKQTGGDAATAEFIGFFDCHVAPNDGWHKELIQILTSGPRRLAVPLILDLNLDTWSERPGGQVNSKCYIDFNAQFMWFEDESDYIPVISGGLLAITRSWWIESGGYDKSMRGWGGENVDQSLRTWLCGGEIIRAKSSRIAHMWRIPSDSRTTARYRHVQGVDNIARVAASWFDKFLPKYKDGSLSRGTSLDVSNVVQLKQTLGCKPFAYFLHRFRKVYQDGGLLPTHVFKMKSTRSGQCIQRVSNLVMAPCNTGSWFHLANRNPTNSSKCCSGIRIWNAMECFDRLDATGPLPYYCDITGGNANQVYRWGDDGFIRHPHSDKCLSVGSGSKLGAEHCDSASTWERVEGYVPMETTLFQSEVQRLGLREDAPAI